LLWSIHDYVSFRLDQNALTCIGY